MKNELTASTETLTHVQVSLRLPSDLKKFAQQKAKKKYMSLNAYITQLLLNEKIQDNCEEKEVN